MNLDDRLKALRFTNIFGDDDTTLTSLTPQAIAQIKQAFADEGYLPFKSYGDIPKDQRPPDWWSKTPTLMTGPEWYARFDSQLKTLVSRGDGETWMGGDCGEVREAAKKASGLK